MNTYTGKERGRPLCPWTLRVTPDKYNYVIHAVKAIETRKNNKCYKIMFGSAECKTPKKN